MSIPGYIILSGAEQVQSAANAMQSAASEMQRAAGNISYALESHQRFLDGWLQRFEAAIERSGIAAP